MHEQITAIEINLVELKALFCDSCYHNIRRKNKGNVPLIWCPHCFDENKASGVCKINSVFIFNNDLMYLMYLL